MVLTGLDQVDQIGLPLPGRGRIALLCNATTVSRNWIATADLLAQTKGINIVRLLSPQHGFASDKQDNMIESPNGHHARLDLPIFSLYSDNRSPTPEALANIDALVIDLQDIGTRVYTFLSTAVLAISAAAEIDLPVIILDRPNPIGGAVAGPVLEDGFSSFVGITDIPLQHGLTLGEACLYGAWRRGLISATPVGRDAADTATMPYTDGSGFLQVIKVSGWSRHQYFDQTELPWTMPSPNMPLLETAIVYPGQVALEGTNLSEGRGTTRPFELFGAPFIRPSDLLSLLADCGYLEYSRQSGAGFGLPGSPLDGVVLRETRFEPTFQKHAGSLARGFQVHVVQRTSFEPIALTTALLWSIRQTHSSDFLWRQPPYEYEDRLLPVDMIFGTDKVRVAIDAGDPPDGIINSWEDGLSRFKDRVMPFLLYGV